MSISDCPSFSPHPPPPSNPKCQGPSAVEECRPFVDWAMMHFVHTQLQVSPHTEAWKVAENFIFFSQIYHYRTLEPQPLYIFLLRPMRAVYMKGRLEKQYCVLFKCGRLLLIFIMGSINLFFFFFLNIIMYMIFERNFFFFTYIFFCFFFCFFFTSAWEKYPSLNNYWFKKKKQNVWNLLSQMPHIFDKIMLYVNNASVQTRVITLIIFLQVICHNMDGFFFFLIWHACYKWPLTFELWCAQWFRKLCW